MKSDAVISECGAYRYSLRREWDADKHTLAWVMLNPSTADALIDDPTIRKCLGFARRLGFGAIEVVNLYALRSTNPKGLVGHDDPTGPDNDRHLAMAIDKPQQSVVVAWGASGPHDVLFHDRIDVIKEMCGGRAVALGYTKGGDPRHPSRLPYNSHPIEWP